MTQRLESEQVVVQAPMSYTGSAKRIWRWTKTGNAAVKWALAVPAAIVAIPLMWVLVTGWYVVFGLLLVPYRLIRRGSRKRRLTDARHREMLNR